MMSTTKQNRSQDTETHEVREGTDRPEGTDDEDANAPLIDMTKTDVHRDSKTVPPQDTGSAMPPYEGRRQGFSEEGTAGRGENEQQSPQKGEAGNSAAADGSDHDDDGVGPTHTPGTGRAED